MSRAADSVVRPCRVPPDGLWLMRPYRLARGLQAKAGSVAKWCVSLGLDPDRFSSGHPPLVGPDRHRAAGAGGGELDRLVPVAGGLGPARRARPVRGAGRADAGLAAL